MSEQVNEVCSSTGETGVFCDTACSPILPVQASSNDSQQLMTEHISPDVGCLYEPGTSSGIYFFTLNCHRFPRIFRCTLP